MKVAISGASGFIGTNLTKHFEEKGYSIVPLDRSFFVNDAKTKLENALIGCDAVINLAGAPINHVWTKSYKQKMIDSRVNTTRSLVQAMNNLEHKPELFISTSAVGFYPDYGCYDEFISAQGDDFLAHLCTLWEAEARLISSDVRLIIARLGVVMDEQGGALDMIRLPMKFKIGTIIGPGSQSLAWIHLTDLMRAIEFIIQKPLIEGVINMVSPEQTTNRKLIKTLAKAENCFFTFTLPSLFFSLVLGEAARFITKGQCVNPQKLLDAGFVFQTPSVSVLSEALKYNC